jgi:hypothetical protein
VDPHRLERKPLDTPGVVGEQVPQVPVADRFVMTRERAPGGALSQAVVQGRVIRGRRGQVS